jgi:hypothetical protein
VRMLLNDHAYTCHQQKLVFSTFQVPKEYFIVISGPWGFLMDCGNEIKQLFSLTLSNWLKNH